MQIIIDNLSKTEHSKSTLLFFLPQLVWAFMFWYWKNIIIFNMEDDADSLVMVD